MKYISVLDKTTEFYSVIEDELDMVAGLPDDDVTCLLEALGYPHGGFTFMVSDEDPGGIRVTLGELCDEHYEAIVDMCNRRLKKQ